ncbi:MAG: hypothetical protein IJO88_08005 [Oscillospiraceae bacterium]|nr:hypothetical protein [Oscillospiraceae bacterium]
MKKLFCILMTVMLLTVGVSADVLWEPYDNDYYWKHYQQASTVAAVYEVPDGLTVNVYTAPVGGKCIKTLEEGTAVYVGFSLKENGEIWATGYPLGDFETEGWFRLGRLQKRYSHEEFVNDNADQIAAEEGWLVASEVGGTIYTWTYPGSGVSDGILEEELLSSGSDYNDGMVSYGLVYTDPDGGRWGYIGYHMGHVGWMYLDDPTDPGPALQLHPEVVNTVTDTAPEEDMTTAPAYGKVFAAVGVVIAITALLIVHIRKKQR